MTLSASREDRVESFCEAEIYSIERVKSGEQIPKLPKYLTCQSAVPYSVCPLTPW